MKNKKCINCNKRLENSTENFCQECMKEFSDQGIKIENDLEEITPLIDDLSEEITISMFEEYWKENKLEIKVLSKKEIALEMFYEGICEALSLAALTGMPKEHYEDLIAQVKFINFFEKVHK